jgi:glycosyltransferase involved in cell wall biosynthesis
VSDRVRFMGRIEPSELHDYCCGASLGVVIYEHTTLNNYLAAPNKLFAYLMAGLPVAASGFPGLSAVLEAEGAGATFDPADEASVSSAMRGMLADRATLAAMGERARLAAKRRKLLEVYERLSAACSTS